MPFCAPHFEEAPLEHDTTVSSFSDSPEYCEVTKGVPLLRMLPTEGHTSSSGSQPGLLMTAWCLLESWNMEVQQLFPKEVHELGYSAF